MYKDRRNFNNNLIQTIMDLNGILIAVGVIVGVALLIKFREVIFMILAGLFYIIRWIVFLPLAFVVPILVTVFNVGEWIALLLLSQISYGVSLAIDVVSTGIDVFILLFVAKLVAPNAKWGTIIASVACLLVQFVNLSSNNVFEIYTMTSPPDSIDWVHTGLTFAVTAFVSYLMIDMVKDE